MKKSIFRSKTVWGFGLAGLIALGQIFGVGVSETAVAQIVQLLTALFGVYGLRDAADK
ncbi:unnamed protein product [marine sediment metagenome]|uniref:Holin n=1 Tax=marine sediment metagenome TaxID=412755 RepID=X1GSJ4_9ZZZZ